jgi:uncharacterized protein (TIGR03435 family)
MQSLLFVLALGILCRAQSPAFEVASVKLNLSGGPGGIRPEPGRFSATNVSLKALVRYAYAMRDDQISGGPSWFDSDHWDVAATSGGDAVSDDARKRMLQALLQQRFQLAVRREMKELPVYSLTVAKNGPKMQPNSSGAKEDLRLQVAAPGLMRLTGVNTTMAKLADTLTTRTGRPVLDRTGISGGFDFKFDWVPDPANMPALNGARMEPNPDGATIFTAVQEQLGLKLEPTKVPIEILVIEHAEKAAGNQEEN